MSLFCLAAPPSLQRTDRHFVPASWQKNHRMVSCWKHMTLGCHSSFASASRTVWLATSDCADCGFCMSQNSNCNGSATGHAMPGLKSNSRPPEIVDAFVALTSFAKHTQPLWRPKDDHFALNDPNILAEFAHKINVNNSIPSLHNCKDFCCQSLRVPQRWRRKFQKPSGGCVHLCCCK
jgi:hypothetical protein